MIKETVQKLQEIGISSVVKKIMLEFWSKEYVKYPKSLLIKNMVKLVRVKDALKFI